MTANQLLHPRLTYAKKNSYRDHIGNSLARREVLCMSLLLPCEAQSCPQLQGHLSSSVGGDRALLHVRNSPEHKDDRAAPLPQAEQPGRLLPMLLSPHQGFIPCLVPSRTILLKTCPRTLMLYNTLHPTLSLCKITPCSDCPCLTPIL